MGHLIKLFRPHQYIKNIFILAPLLFSFQFDSYSIIHTFIAVVLFSLSSSSIYILNDYFDIEADRNHPTKKERPLASGKVSVRNAFIMMGVLMVGVLFVAFFYNFNLFVILALYIFMNILYSAWLKHIAIVDIFIISTGFVFRIFAGSVAIDVSPSHWIILITFLFALFLALAKRRDDVLLSLKGEETRKSIDGYNLEFVNAGMVLMAGVTIVSYVLYTLSPDVMVRFHSDYLYLTTFFVILGVIRYMQITFVEQKSGSPTKIALEDRFIQIVASLWIASFFMIHNI